MRFDGFSLEGRINRARYWRIKIGLLLTNLFFHIWVAAQFSHSTLHRPPTRTGEWILLLGVLVVTVVTLWVSIATDVRRFHDRDKSGWWVFILLVPVVGPVWLLVECGFLAGTPGPNRFGPDPLAVGKAG